MKKHLLISLTTLLLTPLHSNAAMYAGINLGINSVSTKKELTYPLDSSLPTVAQFQTNDTNFHGQIVVGYDFLLKDRFKVALEGDGDLFTGKSQNTIRNWFFDEGVIAQEQLKYGFGLFLLPAYAINTNTQFFIGPGVVTSKFEISSKNSAGNVGVTGPFNRWLTGASFKTGINTSLTSSLDLSLTYQYNAYQSVEWTNVEPISLDSLKGRYKPHVNIVMIGIKKDF